MNLAIRIVLLLLLFPALLSVFAGWMGAPGFLHPENRAFTPDMVRDADVTFKQIGAQREDFNVRAADGVELRGWKVRAAKPNGTWVLVFHGGCRQSIRHDRACANTATARLRRGDDGFARTWSKRRRHGDVRLAGAQGYQRGDRCTAEHGAS